MVENLISIDFIMDVKHSFKGTVMIYDEFTKLHECIVGVSYTHVDIDGLDRIVDETNEDLQNLEYILTDLDVKVHVRWKTT